MRPGKWIILALLTGCFRPVTAPGEPPPQLERAEEAYVRGEDPAGTRHLFEQFREAHPGSPHAARALYFEGLCLLQEGRPILARERLERAIDAAPEPEVEGQARLALGDAYFIEDRFEDAREAYLAAGGSGGAHPTDAAYKAALCDRRLGRWGEAERRWQEIIDRYPGSERADDAREQLAYEDRFFTIQTGAFRLEENAESHAARIRGAGLEPRIRPAGEGADRLYRVTVGEFREYRAARAEAASLREQGIVSEALILP